MAAYSNSNYFRTGRQTIHNIFRPPTLNWQLAAGIATATSRALHIPASRNRSMRSYRQRQRPTVRTIICVYFDFVCSSLPNQCEHGFLESSADSTVIWNFMAGLMLANLPAQNNKTRWLNQFSLWAFTCLLYLVKVRESPGLFRLKVVSSHRYLSGAKWWFRQW